MDPLHPVSFSAGDLSANAASGLKIGQPPSCAAADVPVADALAALPGATAPAIPAHLTQEIFNRPRRQAKAPATLPALPASPDLAAIARRRVRTGPVPEWATPCPYDSEFLSNACCPVTHLLVEQQVHGELHQTYMRAAIRLETSAAAREQSEWRLQFEPGTQWITLHSIKVRRGGSESEHLSLDRVQYLQKETALESPGTDGWVTLLLLLDDVRAGDVLEWSCTLTHVPRLLPQYLDCLFTLPDGNDVGQYHFSVRHADHRRLKWSASSPQFAPVVSSERGETRWVWTGKNYSALEGKDGLRGWQPGQHWIQASDCPDWGTVARAVFEAWQEEVPPRAQAQLADEMQSIGPDMLTRIKRAIELVQEGFSYLSAELESNGRMPGPGETADRSRYGDSKRRALLLVRLLRALGVPARPVLVNSFWRQSVSQMLPAIGAFNHVIVEFQVEHERRWVDATAKSQGGSALKRALTDFGFGLPVDAGPGELARVPAGSLPAGQCEIKETFILDTDGNPSCLEIVERATGVYADALRLEFEAEGAQAISSRRLQICSSRFSEATRIGSLHHRDDRELNEFVIAEAFEISGFLKPDGAEGCLFVIKSEPILGGLPYPAPTRHCRPVSLPFPWNRVYHVEVHFAGMQLLMLPRCEHRNDFFKFSRRIRSLHKFVRVTFALDTLADLVPWDRVATYRSSIEAAREACTVQLRLPVGYRRMHKPADFGTVPGEVPARWRAVELLRRASQAASVKRALLRSTAASRKGRKKLPRLQAIPRRHPHRNRVPRMNGLCLWSLLMMLGAHLGLGIERMLLRQPGTEEAARVILVWALLGVLWSMTLAVAGLRQCARWRQSDRRGKAAAALTLGLGVWFGFMLYHLWIGG